MSSVENTGKCPRCRSFIIAEQSTSHVCRIRTKGAETIWLDWVADGFEDDNGDFVRMAKGLNGVLYGLVVCKHNPPHNLESQWLNGQDNERKPPPDKATVYLEGGCACERFLTRGPVMAVT